MAGDSERLVGSDRVLAVLKELAEHPDGVSLDELAQRIGGSKPTLHRALVSLRRAGLATQTARGVYELGDEFVRLAFRFHAARPEGTRVEPVLRELAATFGETAHFAVLDGLEVVYRAKIDPPLGSVRLSSEIGGRNPAWCTAVGKAMASQFVHTRAQLDTWLGASRLTPRTEHSITDRDVLVAELARTRERGYGLDAQENELGVNCIAVVVPSPTGELAAVSVSALAYRRDLAQLERDVPRIREIVARL
jgi:DNA-binding IclR family transcriptional regulator